MSDIKTAGFYAPSDRGAAVIIHYHLFKNAGTSVDAMLQTAFGPAWIEVEHGWNEPLSRSVFRQFIIDHPECVAFSSHTASLDPPQFNDRAVYPIVFLRHPIDRARSVYAFERQQDADTIGAQKAKSLDFADYVRWRLDLPLDRQIRNFQVTRLAAGSGVISELALYERALLALEAFPVWGRVEAMTQSVERLNAWLAQDFPGLKLTPQHANRHEGRADGLDARLRAIRQELGRSLYDELQAANTLDLALYGAVVSGLGRPFKPPPPLKGREMRTVIAAKTAQIVERYCMSDPSLSGAAGGFRAEIDGALPQTGPNPVVFGWCMGPDKRQPALEIVVDGAPQTTIRREIRRADVVDAGLTDHPVGFECKLPAFYRALDRPARVEVRVSAGTDGGALCVAERELNLT
ncbi:MAG: hypothetical protein ACFB2Z_01175 [Maricaulaceae bacterium]